jgi:hypothetical protein
MNRSNDIVLTGPSAGRWLDRVFLTVKHAAAALRADGKGRSIVTWRA